MLGRSWWKCLGYGWKCGCAHEKREQGHTYMSDFCCGECGRENEVVE